MRRGLEVVTQAYREAGSVFTSSTSRVGGTCLTPRSQSNVSVVLGDGVVGVYTYSFVQLVLDTNSDHVGVKVVSVGITSHPHAFQSSGGSQLQLSAYTVGVGSQSVLNSGGNSRVGVVNSLVKTDQLEAVGDLEGTSSADAVTLAATGIDRNVRVKDLTDDQLVALRDHIEGTYKVEGDLRREVAADIRRKVEIGSYEGLRHRRGLPVRGQRTKTNARTRKGPKRTVAGKKKAR